MKETDLIPHLFRTEFSKITVVLCQVFGLEHIGLAEDIASETFAAALETWPHKGIPAKPVAWLYTVAKNKARNHLNRRRVFTEKIAREIMHSPQGNSGFTPGIGIGDAFDIDNAIDLSDKNITDSQLQMLFAICHPSISTEAQIGLSLRILCGFGLEEIANAFLTNKETIGKKLYRAKQKLKREQVRMELPSATEIDKRLNAVLTTLYLLFNEGYYSESCDRVLRKDLCLEAMRLMYLLAHNAMTGKPAVFALLALMCFHSSRFDARLDDNGEMILYRVQDESLWNNELISKGSYYLNKASCGDKISKYHYEAGIAWWHTVKADTKDKWENVLHLYNQLLIIEYSPVAALNRMYALSKVHGKKAAIAEAEKLNLADNHYYHVLLGELYKGLDHSRAKQHFQKAYSLAKTAADRQIIQKNMSRL